MAKKNSFIKRFHFLARWRNGDVMNICVYGTDKKSSWFRLLKAKKNKKFVHNKDDNFQVKYQTIEESKNLGSFGGGHCQYIMDEKDNVSIN